MTEGAVRVAPSTMGTSDVRLAGAGLRLDAVPTFTAGGVFRTTSPKLAGSEISLQMVGSS